MQGGAPDESVRLRRAIEAVHCENRSRSRSPEGKKEPDVVQPPLDTLHVEDEILISPAIDALLERGRDLFAVSLARPIALLHGDVSVAASRARKHNRVKQGAEQVFRIQQKFRCVFGDWYFSCWAFCAEEEFYLLLLPILFWNVDYRYARHMNWVVCTGLLWGNLLKDVFRLPRPKNVKADVWVNSHTTMVDSTECRDFGYPSTHAMNAVSNTFFTILYLLQHNIISRSFTGLAGVACATIVWIFSIALGRLYLGVHSPMDVKGGILLGIAVAFVAQWPIRFCDLFDGYMLGTAHVGALLMVWITIVLVLHPQPRPMTPTFMQNCVVCGLIFGSAVGFRMETDRRAGRGLFGFGKTAEDAGTVHRGSNDLPLHFLVARTLIGYLLVISARVIFKAFFTRCFHVVGLRPDPRPVPRSASVKDAKKQEIKGWDLWAAAISKTLVYAVLSWTILCGCPCLFEIALKLPCEMNG